MKAGKWWNPAVVLGPGPPLRKSPLGNESNFWPAWIRAETDWGSRSGAQTPPPFKSEFIINSSVLEPSP